MVIPSIIPHPDLTMQIQLNVINYSLIKTYKEHIYNLD